MQDILCDRCSEAISNPICERCYVEEVGLWLRDRDMQQDQIQKTVGMIRESLEAEGHHSDTCVLCGNEGLSICSYCFFLKITRILQKLHFSKKDIKDFLNLFNYRHYQEEYVV